VSALLAYLMGCAKLMHLVWDVGITLLRVIGTLLGYPDRDIKEFYKKVLPQSTKGDGYDKIVSEGKAWLDANQG